MVFGSLPASRCALWRWSERGPPHEVYWRFRRCHARPRTGARLNPGPWSSSSPRRCSARWVLTSHSGSRAAEIPHSRANWY